MTELHGALLADGLIWGTLILAGVLFHEDGDKDSSRALLAAMFLGWAWPLAAAFVAFIAAYGTARTIAASFKAADLPALLPSKPERGAGHVSIAPSDGGELSQTEDT